MSNTQPLTEFGPGLSGYFSRPGGGPGGHPAVVVLMEAFGLTPHIRRVCDRLSMAGFAAAAPDIYHGAIHNYTDMDSAIGSLKALRDDQVMSEIVTTMDYLSRQPRVDTSRCAVMGFCMGGRLAFLAGTRLASRLSAAVCFYGGGIAPPDGKDRLGRKPPIDEAGELGPPTLLVYGGGDNAILPAEHARIAGRLSELQKRYSLSLYPNAQHGFCCEDRPSFHPVSADAALAEAIDFLRRTCAS